MIPFKLNKEECVLVSGSFSRDDILGLNENPTILSAKVSSIRNTVVDLYVKGYRTYLFRSNGLFDMIVVNVLNSMINKGLSIAIIFIKPYPEISNPGSYMEDPERFTHLSCCFSDTKEEFDEDKFTSFLTANASCVLYPSKVKTPQVYNIRSGAFETPVMESLLN